MLIILFAIKFCVSYNIFLNEKTKVRITYYGIGLFFVFTFLFLISLEFRPIHYMNYMYHTCIFVKKIFYCEKNIKYRFFGFLLFWHSTANFLEINFVKLTSNRLYLELIAQKPASVCSVFVAGYSFPYFSTIIFWIY